MLPKKEKQILYFTGGEALVVFEGEGGRGEPEKVQHILEKKEGLYNITEGGWDTTVGHSGFRGGGRKRQNNVAHGGGGDD